jgi:hypothetical protein
MKIVGGGWAKNLTESELKALFFPVCSTGDIIYGCHFAEWEFFPACIERVHSLL